MLQYQATVKCHYQGEKYADVLEVSIVERHHGEEEKRTFFFSNDVDSTENRVHYFYSPIKKLLKI